MLAQVSLFRLDGEPIFCARFGRGHINETYLLVDATGREYILQKINRDIFPDPAALMRNISLVTAHLRRTADSPRAVLALNKTLAGDDWLLDGEGGAWRLYDFVADSLSLEKAGTAADFLESAVAFGHFQRRLADFPAERLTETIPRFHDTPHRYAALQQALDEDAFGRAAGVGREVDFALARKEYASTLEKRVEAGDLPLRVTHNDTKLNNVLLDRHTRRALCVIDLDTVMPGLSVNDFGDSIRFGASTAAEDERDLSRVALSLPLFEAYTRGYLLACRQSLTEGEIESLCDGAKMMTLECGVRFLTDHLAGDTYFRIHREGQNLDRCRTQFALLARMERAWDDMRRIVQNEAGQRP